VRLIKEYKKRIDIIYTTMSTFATYLSHLLLALNCGHLVHILYMRRDYFRYNDHTGMYLYIGKIGLTALPYVMPEATEHVAYFFMLHALWSNINFISLSAANIVMGRDADERAEEERKAREIREEEQRKAYAKSEEENRTRRFYTWMLLDDMAHNDRIVPDKSRIMNATSDGSFVYPNNYDSFSSNMKVPAPSASNLISWKPYEPRK